MKQIAKEIDAIEQISQQTRMLSLNATIEAGKAQDYGKGFAVVASEVRQLAGRTQSTAKTINRLATSGVRIVKKSGDDILQLVPEIQKTAELVQEISAASGEQTSGTRQVNMAVQQLDSVIQEHSATSEQLASTAQELAAQSKQLQHTIASFNVDVQGESPQDERYKDEQQTSDGYAEMKDERTDAPEKQRAKKDDSGISLKVSTNESGRDARDDDFERF